MRGHAGRLRSQIEAAGHGTCLVSAPQHHCGWPPSLLPSHPKRVLFGAKLCGLPAERALVSRMESWGAGTVFCIRAEGSQSGISEPGDVHGHRHRVWGN